MPPVRRHRLVLWSVVKASAVGRMGRPLLVAWAVLLAVGALIVGASIFAMHL